MTNSVISSSGFSGNTTFKRTNWSPAGAPPLAGMPLPFRRRTLSLLEPAGGIGKRVTLSDGRVLDLKIPPGTEDGQTLRLKGQGRKLKGRAGDAFIEITVAPDPLFQRDGQDLTVDTPVTLYEAVLGGSITVPTIHGRVTVKVPAGSNSDKILRLKGKGIPVRALPAATKGARWFCR